MAVRNGTDANGTARGAVAGSSVLPAGGAADIDVCKGDVTSILGAISGVWVS